MWTAELILPASSEKCSGAMESPIVMLSKEMLRVQLAGMASYHIGAESAYRADKEAGTCHLRCGWVGQNSSIENSFQTQPPCSSVLYKVALTGKKLVINLLKSDDKTMQDKSDPESTGYIAYHRLEKNYVAAAVCLIATRPLQNLKPLALWDRLGRAAMTVFNENNAISCGVRVLVRTLIVNDWGLATEVSARRSFLLGMASQFQPGISVRLVETIEPPC